MTVQPVPSRGELGGAPAGIEWGQVISVQPDARGNIWVFHRKDPPILEFDTSGKLVRSFGAGMFVQPHWLAIDHDGNICG